MRGRYSVRACSTKRQRYAAVMQLVTTRSQPEWHSRTAVWMQGRYCPGILQGASAMHCLLAAFRSQLLTGFIEWALYVSSIATAADMLSQPLHPPSMHPCAHDGLQHKRNTSHSTAKSTRKAPKFPTGFCLSLPRPLPLQTLASAAAAL